MQQRSAAACTRLSRSRAPARSRPPPPREPWEYDEALVEDFRRALGLRYSLMPYIVAQAKDSSARGFPVLRAPFFEYPGDPTCWLPDGEVRTLNLRGPAGAYALQADPLRGRVNWRVTRFPAR